MRRTLLIVAWVVASLGSWYALMSVAAAALLQMSSTRQVFLPDWVPKVFSLGFGFGGLIVVPVIFAFLGMRGKLPGTSKVRGAAPRGFPMDR